MVTGLAVAVASGLAVMKLVGYLVTDSIAMLSSMVDSLLDVGASVLNLLAVRASLMPADEEHRYGHGKAEPLAGLAQAAFISGSAVFLVVEAAHRLLYPQPLDNSTIGIAITVIAFLATGGLVAVQQSVAKRTQSVAVAADRLHYLTDLLGNATVLVALAGTWWLGVLWLDPVLGLLLALFILRSALTVGHSSLNMLMDRELPEEERQAITQRALAVPGVLGVHDLRTRRSGPDVFIELHIELDDRLLLVEAHRIADAVEQACAAGSTQTRVMVHQDPRPAICPGASLETAQ
ncbi:MAG: cation diffusion facilitator family transporter [Alphaproteobacteria bacterium]|nr:MAG: cation diffusion facilitator family transporter [Alphaproteobacteria bacterium]